MNNITAFKPEGPWDPKQGQFEVAYNGFLGKVRRTFETKQDAIYWARCVGKYPCTITKLTD